MKKCLSLLLAVLVFSLLLTGCFNPETVMTVGGVDIPAGVYLHYQLEAAYEAASLNGTYFVDEALLSSSVEDAPVREWIFERMLPYLREYAYVESEFERMGLSKHELNSLMVMYRYNMQSEWNQVGTVYNSNGIGYKTFEAIYRNSLARNMIYEAMYVNENAPMRVPDAEVQDYYFKNYSVIDTIRLENKDADGIVLDEAGLAELKEMAETMCDIAQTAAETAGRFFADEENMGLRAALDWYFDEIEATEEDRENNSSLMSSGNVVSLVPTPYPLYSDDILAAVLETSYETYSVFQNSSETVIICRRHVEEAGEEQWEGFSANIIQVLKGEEFTSFIKNESAGLEISKNERAIKYYRPDKIKAAY